MGQAGWSEALGAHAAKPFIEHNGVKFSFTLDAPVVLAECEQMCRAWHRKRMDELLASMPDRDRPGTLGHEFAEAELRAYRDDFHNGEFNPPTGRRWLQYAATFDGKVSYLTAALRPDHPGITAAQTFALVTAHPTEVRAVMSELGKRATAQREAAAAITAGEAAESTSSPSSPNSG